MNVILTGFEPFDGETINPSWEAVSQSHPRKPMEILRIKLPTAFKKAPLNLLELLHRVKPDYLIMVGQAGNTHSIQLERVAINIDDARIPDNLGQRPIDTPIVENAPLAYLSTLPIKFLLDQLTMSHIPAMISNSAGTFVCNHVFYRIMHELSKSHLDTKAGFIHVPKSESQISDSLEPHMPLSTTKKGIETILEALWHIHHSTEIM